MTTSGDQACRRCFRLKLVFALVPACGKLKQQSMDQQMSEEQRQQHLAAIWSRVFGIRSVLDESNRAAANANESDIPTQEGESLVRVGLYTSPMLFDNLGLPFSCFEWAEGRALQGVAIHGVAIVCSHGRVQSRQPPLRDAAWECKGQFETPPLEERALEWYEPEGSSPRERLSRCLFGNDDLADVLLASFGRESFEFCCALRSVAQSEASATPVLGVGLGRNGEGITRACYLALLAAASIWMPRPQIQRLDASSTSADFVRAVKMIHAVAKHPRPPWRAR